MNQKAIVMNVIFLAAIIFSIVVTKHLMQTATKFKENNPYSPDSYMVNATYLRTNEQGKQDIALAAPLIKHYPNKNSSVFINPSIILSKNNQQWHITAQQGRGINGTEKFILDNHVIVKQIPSAKSPGTQLTTQSLTILPKQDLVHTDEVVFIEQPGIKVSGKGMRGNLKSGDIQLLSKSRGQYDPKRTR